MEMLVLAAHLSGKSSRLQQAGLSMLSVGFALLAVALVVTALEMASA